MIVELVASSPVAVAARERRERGREGPMFVLTPPDDESAALLALAEKEKRIAAADVALREAIRIELELDR
jgi:hypothetical protein